MFVAVGSLYQYRNAVDTETSVLDFRGTETNFTSGQFSDFTLVVFQFEHECIKVGMFRIPGFHIWNLLFIKCYEIT